MMKINRGRCSKYLCSFHLLVQKKRTKELEIQNDAINPPASHACRFVIPAHRKCRAFIKLIPAGRRLKAEGKYMLNSCLCRNAFVNLTEFLYFLSEKLAKLLFVIRNPLDERANHLQKSLLSFIVKNI
jgi:hypothetical protein